MVPCPSCGVPVAAGYPRCPRCHAAVPVAPRQKRETFREQNLAGGTSLEPPARASNTGMLVGLGLVVVAIGAGAMWLSMRGGGSARPPPQPAVASDDDSSSITPDDDPVEVRAGSASSAFAPQPKQAAAGDDGHAALRALDDSLRTDRLWSKVSREGGVVVIESTACDDKAMAPAIARVGNALHAGGFLKVRCQEPNGHVTFENGL